MKVKDDGWTPRLRGNIYCSPRCGGARGYCTYEQYIKAVRAGRALAKRLGKGWRGEIHENLGWHFKAVHVKTGVMVHDHGHGSHKSFWATTPYNTAPQQFHHTDTTPAKAVRGMLAQMDAITKLQITLQAELSTKLHFRG